jgi:transposase
VTPATASVLDRITLIRATQAAEENRHRAARAALAHTYAAAVADLVTETGTQEAAAQLLGVGQSRIAALVKRARTSGSGTNAGKPRR